MESSYFTIQLILLIISIQEIKMLYQDKKSAAERRLNLIIFVLSEHVY
ncbi:Hypothetical protein ETEE_3899 [Edwardsiella anguillarum ET080813]|uniref:Uncharacterized protein n=1 Tax=Edwardsiella anguillarum ET080813 TaxID=667120 RepID=A0A076LV33_9GAMM|nr:Hypothetical protein ETEE_3899 [Edwardsiella anguillarum ET080813]